MRRFKVTVDDKTYDVAVEEVGEVPPATPKAALAPSASSAGASERIAPPAASPPPVAPTRSAGTNDVASPLSGTVVEVHVAEGQEVQQGEKLVTLEAMKMNTAVSAPRNGKVESVKAQVGASVQEGQVLLTLS